MGFFGYVRDVKAANQAHREVTGIKTGNIKQNIADAQRVLDDANASEADKAAARAVKSSAEAELRRRGNR